MKLNIVFFKIGVSFLMVSTKQLHKTDYFIFRSVPIFSRKHKGLNIQCPVRRAFHNIPHAFNSMKMTIESVFPFSFAHRPLPSIIIATCLWRRVLSILSQQFLHKPLLLGNAKLIKYAALVQLYKILMLL